MRKRMRGAISASTGVIVFVVVVVAVVILVLTGVLGIHLGK